MTFLLTESVCVPFVTRRSGQQYVPLPHSASLDLNSLVLIALRCICVFQSAAMEETVIWEQHTVTLHRVCIFCPPFRCSLHLPMLSLVSESLYPVCFAIFASIPHPCFFSSHFQDHIMWKCDHWVHICTCNRQNRGIIMELFFCMIISNIFGCGA